MTRSNHWRFESVNLSAALTILSFVTLSAFADGAEHSTSRRSSVVFRDTVAAQEVDSHDQSARDVGTVMPNHSTAGRNASLDYFRQSTSRGRRRPQASVSNPPAAATIEGAPGRKAAAKPSLPIWTAEEPLEKVVINTDEQGGEQQEPTMSLPGGRRTWAPIRAADPAGAGAASGEVSPQGKSAPLVNPPAPAASARPARPMSPVEVTRPRRPHREKLIYSSSLPAIRVDAQGPQSVLIGRPATFKVVLQNQGTESAADLSVRITVPDGVDLTSAEAMEGEIDRDNDSQRREIRWVFDHLKATSSHVLELSIVPRSSQPIEIGIQWTLLPQSDTVTIETIRPDLQLTLDGPAATAYGETPKYTIRVANRGTGLAEDAVVELTTSRGRSKSIPIGAIEAGAETEFQFELAGLEPGITEVAATAKCLLQQPCRVVRSIRVEKAELFVDSFGPASQTAGSQVDYEIHVRNVGTAAASDVVVRAALPAGVSAALVPPGADQRDGEVAWQIDELAAGQSRSYRLVCDLRQAGLQRVAFTVADRWGNQASSELRTSVVAKSDVRMSVAVGKGKVPVDTECDYEIRLENHGFSAARDVVVVMYFADGIEPMAVAGADAQISNGIVRFEPVRELPRDQSHVLRVTARAHQEGVHAYRVELTSANPGTQLAYEGMTGAYVPHGSAEDVETAPE